MVFAAGCVFSSTSKHGPHKSCTLSLNKSLTVREKPGSCGHFPKPWRSFSRPFAGTFRLPSGPEFSCSSPETSASPQTANRQAFVCMAIILLFFVGGGRGGFGRPSFATCVRGKLDAQPDRPAVRLHRTEKVTQNGNETWAEK